MLPIRFATPEAFATVRCFLLDVPYLEQDICRRVGIETIYDFQTLREGRAADPAVTDALDLLVRLFMDGEGVERRLVHALVPADVLGAMRALGLLAGDAAEAAPYEATVLLYPTRSLFVASDLNSVLGALPSEPTMDAVYPAITSNTGTFMDMLPDTRCESFLELCAGTGIAALAASRYARQAWAADITDRSTQFARFNAMLNDLDNVTAVQGDLYVPLSGRTFDRIVAHPPYVATFEQRFIYRDGGQDGEQITRRILEGLPDHLRPGGRFYCTCVATDRKGAPLEQRIRHMLGSHQSEFDVLVVTMQTYHPTEYHCRLAAGDRTTFAEAERWHRFYRQLEVEGMAYSWIVVQRHDATRPAFTVRRKRGARTGNQQVEWLLQWESMAAAPEMPQRLLDAHPRISPHARLRAVHRVENGDWVPETCVVSTEEPFPLSAECGIDVAAFLARCDGTRTAREHLGVLRTSGVVSPEMSDDDFAGLVRSFVSGGLLLVDMSELRERADGRASRELVPGDEALAPARAELHSAAT